MGSTADKLSKLIETKEKIRQSINNKGGNLEPNTPFSSYSLAIDNLSELGGVGAVGATVNEIKIIERTISGDYSNEHCENVGDYSFYNCTNLTSINFLKVKNVGDYSFYNCTNLTSINFLKVKNVGDYSFYNCSSLVEYDLSINGSVGNYSFYNNRKAKTINFSDFNITSLGQYAFSQFGGERENYTEVMNIDLINSKFSSIPSYCFGCSSSTAAYKNRYIDYYFSNTLKTIGAYAFRYNDNCNYYFENDNPPTLSATTSWSNATNFNIFAPYYSINAYKTGTNWTTNSSNIKGYAKENTLTSFIEINGEGYALTWYDDIACTTLATTIENDKKYYCIAGEKVGYGIKIGVEKDCKVTISDGDKTYSTREGILAGTTVTITVKPTMDGYIPYILQLNGETFESGTTIEVNEDISITAIYYDGTNIPIDPTFENNSWIIIASACREGVASQYWNIGDTKKITLTDGNEYTIRICDMTQGRYDYSDGSGSKTNVVFEMVEILPTTYQMNSSNTNTGGWAESLMKTTNMETIFNMLPSDLQSVLKEINIVSSIGGGSTTSETVSTSANKIFLPSEFEILGATSYSIGSSEGQPQYELYNENNTSSFIIKYRNGSAYYWWLRSPHASSVSDFCSVNSNGNAYSYIANFHRGVSPCFAF